MDFMEALARLANTMPIPSDQDMKDVEVNWPKFNVTARASGQLPPFPD